MKTLKNLLCACVVTCSLCFCLTGCGNSNKGSTSGNNDSNMVNDVADDVGNAAGDLVEGAGNAVEDVVDGVGNAAEDLVGMKGFDNYDDAHKYFMETMGNYHSDAKFEIRDEERDLEDYQEGSKGYRFKLYDTSKNEKGDFFGEFYVDADTGMIYHEIEDDKYVEYRGSATNNTTTTGNGNNTNSRNATDNSTNNTTGTNTGNENMGTTDENMSSAR
ncbi:MAG: ubiquinone biosynthesis protein [Lachnospiraceae bacterium]|nr:ubiquinone biosynthesis protein [Lachnospiraceae bacterium]